MLKHTIAVFAGAAVMIGIGQAYQVKPVNWKYMANPMGKDWELCATGMPGEAADRTKEGAKAWNYTKFKFTFKADDCSSGGAFPKRNNVNQIDYATLPTTNPFTLAETYTWFKNSTEDILECDMRFNDKAKWNTSTKDPKADEYDWLSVAAHEFGHCLGLDHSGVKAAVMYKSSDPGKKRRDLATDDTDGRAAIYGK